MVRQVGLDVEEARAGEGSLKGLEMEVAVAEDGVGRLGEDLAGLRRSEGSAGDNVGRHCSEVGSVSERAERREKSIESALEKDS